MKRTRLRRVSPKRRAALSARVRVGVEIPATCELCDLLDGVESWHKFSADWPAWAWAKVDPHHVYSRRLDDPCNVVAACRVAHEYCHDCWQRAGRVVATEALCRAGRFDRERIREAWGKDPIAAIELDWSAGVFASDQVLTDMAIVLLGRF